MNKPNLPSNDRNVKRDISFIIRRLNGSRVVGTRFERIALMPHSLSDVLSPPVGRLKKMKSRIAIDMIGYKTQDRVGVNSHTSRPENRRSASL